MAEETPPFGKGGIDGYCVKKKHVRKLTLADMAGFRVAARFVLATPLRRWRVGAGGRCRLL